MGFDRFRAHARVRISGLLAVKRAVGFRIKPEQPLAGLEIILTQEWCLQFVALVQPPAIEPFPGRLRYGGCSAIVAMTATDQEGWEMKFVSMRELRNRPGYVRVFVATASSRNPRLFTEFCEHLRGVQLLSVRQ